MSKEITREEVFRLMVKDDGNDCLAFIVLEQEEKSVAITYNLSTLDWWVELWNDYQDYHYGKMNISEEVALDFINQQVSPNKLEQTTPKDIEEVKCSKCNYSGNHLLKLSHQNMSDRVKYECLNCGNIEVVSTSTPQLSEIEKSKIELLLGRSELEPYEILCLINKLFDKEVK